MSMHVGTTEEKKKKEKTLCKFIISQSQSHVTPKAARPHSVIAKNGPCASSPADERDDDDNATTTTNKRAAALGRTYLKNENATVRKQAGYVFRKRRWC